MLKRSDFESNLLGREVAQLPPALADQCDVALAAERWRRDGIWLVSCRIPAGNQAAERRLLAAGFRCVEVLVTHRRDFTGAEQPAAGVRLACPEDRSAILAIAASAFRHDRLHADPQIPDWAADVVRAHWIANDLAGRADANIVVEHDGRVAGFLLGLRREPGAVIDLIAVAPEFQGRRLAGKLVESVPALMGMPTVGSLVAGTQDANVQSMAFYARNGFAETGRQLTFHWVNGDVAPSQDPRPI